MKIFTRKIYFCTNYEILIFLSQCWNRLNRPKQTKCHLKRLKQTKSTTSRAHKVKVKTPRVGVDAPENSFIVKSSRLWNNFPDKLCLTSNILIVSKLLSKTCILKAIQRSLLIVVFLSFHWSSYYFEMLYDAIYAAEIALLRNINLPLQLNRQKHWKNVINRYKNTTMSPGKNVHHTIYWEKVNVVHGHNKFDLNFL
jgi:hypothetical protein